MKKSNSNLTETGPSRDIPTDFRSLNNMRRTETNVSNASKSSGPTGNLKKRMLADLKKVDSIEINSDSQEDRPTRNRLKKNSTKQRIDEDDDGEELEEYFPSDEEKRETFGNRPNLRTRNTNRSNSRVETPQIPPASQEFFDFYVNCNRA